MSKPFDIELFLHGVLTGSYSSRQRHIRQARLIQRAINDRWGRDNPWTWKQKHIEWFFDTYLGHRSGATLYYYRLTMDLIESRQGKSWRSPVTKNRSPRT